MQNCPKEVSILTDSPPETSNKNPPIEEEWSTINFNHKGKDRHPSGHGESSDKLTKAASGKSSNFLPPKPNGSGSLKLIPSINPLMGFPKAQSNLETQLDPSTSSKISLLGPVSLTPSDKEEVQSFGPFSPGVMMRGTTSLLALLLPLIIKYSLPLLALLLIVSFLLSPPMASSRQNQPQTLVFSTKPLELNHFPMSWLKIYLSQPFIPLRFNVDERHITLLIQDPHYLAQLIREGINQGLINYGQNMWMTIIRSIFTQGLATSWSADLVAAELSNISQSLPFFPSPMPELLLEGPLFVKNSEASPSPVLTPLSKEMMERDRTLEALRERNREMENILASLKPARSETTLIEKTISHFFKDLTSKILLGLIPMDLCK
ncbi:hypothetical protein FXO37_03303 [Capsicum annuum]|nr:hypothetical protein FXO37_03303 [Capsicum annuum]